MPINSTSATKDTIKAGSIGSILMMSIPHAIEILITV
jgi:hypothetical protein